jgi:uncharacterized membrane protein
MSFRAALTIAHILFAAVTVGATVAYASWIAFAERHPEHLAFTIRAVRRSDRILAIPAFVLTLVTGLWLVAVAGLALDARWLVISLALYLAVLVVGFAVFGPVVRREIEALERGGISDPEYLRLRLRARVLSYGTIVALVAITVLMVVRPS